MPPTRCMYIIMEKFLCCHFLVFALCLVKYVDLQLFESFHIVSRFDIHDYISNRKQLISQLINLDADTGLWELYPRVGAAEPGHLRLCYNATVTTSGEEYNIFRYTIFEAIMAFYKYFPENFKANRFCNKVKSLFKSFNEIGCHTTRCLIVQTNYQLGLTQLADFSDAEYEVLLGARGNDLETVFGYMERRRERSRTKMEDNSVDSNKNRKTKRKNKNKDLSYRRYKRQEQTIDAMCFPQNKEDLPEKFDWRRMGKVTPAKYQGECGSCWAFASIACVESAYLIKGKTKNKNFNLSEMEVAGCAKSNGCKGGTSVDAFNYFLDNRGVTSEKSLPYDSEKLRCKKRSNKVAKIKDYCLRGIYSSVNGKPEMLKDEDIQRAIREFGPVYSTMDANHLAVKHHKSGIYTNPRCSNVTNHAVTIVGWTRRSWIIKNSWGNKWADQGFFKMKRDVNLCGINTYITYPIV